MQTQELINEIQDAFPNVEMPSSASLPFHGSGCFQCEFLVNELDEYRQKTVGVELLRLVHQEMSCLSAEGWRWILPHYLLYGLTAEASYSQMEVEFLVYNLSPAPEFQPDTLQRLSMLNSIQRRCIVDFLEWCANHPHWSEYFPENIAQAIEFVNSIPQHCNE